MGNTFAKESITIYIYKLAVFRPLLQHMKFIAIENLHTVNWQKCFKVLMPINQVVQNHDLVLKKHHQIILVRCGFQQQRVLANVFKFMQIQFFNQIKDNQSIIFRTDATDSQSGMCYKSQTSSQLPYQTHKHPCPIAFIFNEMHYLAVRHCRKSLSYYNLPSIFYAHPLQFLESDCKTSSIICGLKQLEYIIDKIVMRKFTINANTNISVFCKMENISQMNTLKTIGLSKNVNIEYYQNFLTIIEQLLSRNTLPLSVPQNKIQIQRILLIMNGKSRINDDDASSLKKFGKRLKSIKLKKVDSLQDLSGKLKDKIFSTLIIDRSIKNFVQISNFLEQNALSDRVFLIRKKSQISDQLKERIQKFTRSNFYQGLRKQLKKVIVIGSENFLYRILLNISCVDVKMFIKPDQHQKIIDILKRQNQIIIVKLQVLKFLGKQTVLMSQVICYQPNESVQRDHKLDCCQKISFCSNQASFLKLMNQQRLPFVLPFSYEQKKIFYICQHISTLFSRLVKQNGIIKDSSDNISFFTCQDWIFDQVTNLLNQILTSKYMANYYISAVFSKIKGKVGQQILKIHDLLIIQQQTVVNILQIEEEEAFSYCQKFMVIFCKSKRFKTIVNKFWSQMLFQKQIEHLLFIPHIFFVIFLSFSKVKKIHQVIQEKVILKIQSCKFGANTAQQEQFINKLRHQQKYFVHNYQFLYCSQIAEQKNSFYQPVVIQIESQEITSFKSFFNFHKFGKLFIIPPLTKFKICLNSNNIRLILKNNYSQRFMKKFSNRYFQFQTGLTQLVPTQPLKQKLTHYLKQMQTNKYVSASVTISQLIKQSSSDLEKRIMIGYKVVTLIKRRLIKTAQQALKVDNPFYLALKNYIYHLKRSIAEKHSKQINQVLKKQNSTLTRFQTTKKWRVDYIPQLQKFGIVQKQKQTQYQTYKQQNFQITFSNKCQSKGFLQVKRSFDQYNQNDEILDSYDLKDQQYQINMRTFMFKPTLKKDVLSLISDSDDGSHRQQKDRDSFVQQKSQTQRISYKQGRNSSRQLNELFKNSIVPQNRKNDNISYQKPSIFSILYKNACNRKLLPKLSRKHKVSIIRSNETDKNRIFSFDRDTNLAIIKQINQNEQLGSFEQSVQNKSTGNELFSIISQQIQQEMQQEIEIE